MTLTPPEAAERPGVRLATLKNWERRGWLPVDRYGLVNYRDVLLASTRSIDLYGVVEAPTQRHRLRPLPGRD